ncbi:MAG: hypothetical protein AABX10_01535, partial [Nanoarchaeota archaeon]
MNERLIKDCKLLIEAYKSGRLGQTKMPEDSNPGFQSQESRLAYFTLPMALNYQRDSYKLWESTLKAYNDSETRVIFDITKVASMDEGELRELLTKHKVALQPNKQTNIWKVISKTIYENFGSFENLMKKCDSDYLKLKETIQVRLKKGFPYLSGPKIFNYWSFIMKEYGKVPLKNAHYIEIAPDTHVTQCSVLLGVITKEEAERLGKDKISE